MPMFGLHNVGIPLVMNTNHNNFFVPSPSQQFPKKDSLSIVTLIFYIDCYLTNLRLIALATKTWKGAMHNEIINSSSKFKNFKQDVVNLILLRFDIKSTDLEQKIEIKILGIWADLIVLKDSRYWDVLSRQLEEQILEEQRIKYDISILKPRNFFIPLPFIRSKPLSDFDLIDLNLYIDSCLENLRSLVRSTKPQVGSIQDTFIDSPRNFRFLKLIIKNLILDEGLVAFFQQPLLSEEEIENVERVIHYGIFLLWSAFITSEYVPRPYCPAASIPRSKFIKLCPELIKGSLKLKRTIKLQDFEQSLDNYYSLHKNVMERNLQDYPYPSDDFNLF